MTSASIVLAALCAAASAAAQELPTPAPAAPAAPAVTPPAVATLAVPPLASADFNSPYASPCDAARHWMQSTLSDLGSRRNVRDAIRGFAQAFLLDRTYAAAAFDLGIVCAIDEKWDDAVGALEEASRLDPNGLGAAAAPQLERLRLLASLEKTPDGRLRRRYDEALLPVVAKLDKTPPAEAMAALAAVGRLDPKRWEAPALLAGLSGDGRGYEAAAKFLRIALDNAAAEPAVRTALENALRAAERELRYGSARAGAEAAADRGDYAKAAELYEAAWTTIPARAANGFEASSALLLNDDTAHASALLVRLTQIRDARAAQRATAMLKELEPIEPAAKALGADASAFYRDPGTPDPVRIAAMIPPIDRSRTDLYSRPLPKLVDDPEPVVLLAALLADAPAGAPPATTLPPLSAPAIAGDHPWLELQEPATRTTSDPAGTGARAPQTADLSGDSRNPRVLSVTSEPAGARLFIGEASNALCETPCDIRITPGTHTVKLSLPGYRDAEKTVRVLAKTEAVNLPLAVVRGSVIVDAPAGSALKLNGTPVDAQAPVELSLVPGLYRIGADFAGAAHERLLTIRPGTRLRIEFR